MLVEAFVRFGGKYFRKFQDSMLPSHKKALINFTQCRTDTYGKLQSTCTSCGLVVESNGACRNRACPKCNNSCTKAWIARQEARFPRVSYHHLVFTVPSELRYIARQNQAVFYEKLMAAVCNTLTHFGQSQKWVKGRIGFMSVLHTWDSKLNIHPHVHVLLMGGYLEESGQWVEVKRQVMFPHRAMASRFKTVLLKSLRKELEEKIPSSIWKLPFVIYSKKTFPGSRSVLKYLGQYIKRIGIGPSRIVSVDKFGVTFKYRHRLGPEQHEFREMRLSGEEFLRRYHQHILPKGFIRVRYYGLLHPYFKEDLAEIRDANGKEKNEIEEEISHCKQCRECKLPMVTTFLLLPVFQRLGMKKGSKFYINTWNNPTDLSNNEIMENPSYNQLLEPTAVLPVMPPACASGPPGRRVPPASTPGGSAARYAEKISAQMILRLSLS